MIRYDIECDWHLLMTCNFRCAYCFFPPRLLGEKLIVHASPDDWGAAFDATGKRWLIHITGGEPTIYPDFADLCARLTERHAISLNSNLSGAQVAPFVERVDPARVNFINAGLHVEERARRGGLERYLANLHLLADAGFTVLPTIVATSAVVARLDELAEHLAAHGVTLAPKILRGGHDGKVYPRDYTPGEKAHLRHAIARARNHYAPIFEQAPAGYPSIDVIDDDALLEGWSSFRGQPCSAGSRFVRMSANGDVFRCSTATALGNLLLGTLRLRTAPSPCDTTYCVYFCQKYTADARARPAPARPVQAAPPAGRPAAYRTIRRPRPSGPPAGGLSR